MADFFFFTDQNLLTDIGSTPNPQLSTDSFGDLGTDTSGNDLFLVSSVHKSNLGNPLAYAVTRGRVAVYEHSNGVHATLVLKPENQPSENKNVDLPPIKYYIYRGVLKSSLINGLTVASNGGNIDMINYIWDHYPPSVTSSIAAPKEVILVTVDGTLGIQTPISRSFADKPSGASPLHTIDHGESIGQFDSGGFSFEIIFDDYNFDPTIEILETIDPIRHFISEPAIPSSGDAALFTSRHKREQVLHYLDPAAFYGSMYFVPEKTLKYKAGIGSSVTDVTNVYSQLVAKFYNKNHIYIDIRNEHEKSFNYYSYISNLSPTKRGYYSRYQDPVLIEIANGSSDTTITSNSYYSTGWPLRKLLLPSGLIANNDEKNIYKITLREDQFNVPSFYGQMIYLANGFINKGGAGSNFPKKVPQEADRFIDLPSAPFMLNHFGPFEIPVPNIPSTTDVLPVCWYTRVHYIRTKQKDFSTALKLPTNLPHPNYFADYLFFPLEINLPIPVTTTDQIAYNIFNTNTYVNLMQDNRLDYVGRMGLAEDNLYVTAFMIPVATRLDLKSASPIINLKLNLLSTFFKFLLTF
jgi:hypothetical protein